MMWMWIWCDVICLMVVRAIVYGMYACCGMCRLVPRVAVPRGQPLNITPSSPSPYIQCSNSTAQHNTTQHSTTQHNTTQHNTTQHNTTQHSTAQHSYSPIATSTWLISLSKFVCRSNSLSIVRSAGRCLTLLWEGFSGRFGN